MANRVRWKFVRRQAAKLLLECGILAPPVEVDAIADELGIEVYESALGPDVSGMLVYKKELPVIYVNNAHHENRKRFSIAHELGHFVLSHDFSDKVHVDRRYRVAAFRDNRSSEGTQPIEIEANEFAANLLMPTDMLAAAVEGYEIPLEDDEILELARSFKVSSIAMSHRVTRLGYSDQT